MVVVVAAVAAAAAVVVVALLVAVLAVVVDISVSIPDIMIKDSFVYSIVSHGMYHDAVFSLTVSYCILLC